MTLTSKHLLGRNTAIALAACATAATSNMASAQSTSSDIAEIQTHLTYLGFNPAGIDGQVGGGTRSAIRQFQLQNGLSVTGLPNSRTKKVLLQVVNSKLATQFGKPLSGEYGTAASCRIPSARLKIDGLHVFHKPTWADTGFDYLLYPTGGDRFKIQWDGSRRQTGLSVQYDAQRNAFRVPEMQMLALSKCPEVTNGSTTTNSVTAPSVPRVPQTPYGSVSSEMDTLALKLKEAEELRATIKAKLERRTGRFGNLRAQVNSLEANLSAAQSEADGLRTRLRKSNATIKDLRKRLTDLGVERDNLLAENNQLINQRGAETGQQIARLKSTNAALRQENQQLRAMLQQSNGNQQTGNQGLQFQTKDGRFQFSFGGR